MQVQLLVVGATPAGIGAAVRAAREGLRVALINRTLHVGGMLASGLQGFDTIYAGARAPLLDELLQRMQQIYRERYGDDSEQLQLCSYRDPSRHGARPRFEPHVAEAACDAMLEAESAITVLRGWVPVAVERAGSLLQALEVQRYVGDERQRIAADTFVDATYEGDLAALAGAPYRVGREARREYDEPHAGRIFTRIHPARYPKAAFLQQLNLHMFSRSSGEIYAGSTGEGDSAVMAYCARLVLSSDPTNRISIERPPSYDREAYAALLDDEVANFGRPSRLASSWLLRDPDQLSFGGGGLPNGKKDWLGGNLVEASHAYPDADWQQREQIITAHVEFALGLIYFLQHDQQVPAAMREETQKWGLPRDEFTDNGGIPWEIYVREARRIIGRAVFTEHDATLAPGLQRAPIKVDSVGITEWPMDSHDCHAERVAGSMNEGEIMLTEKNRPGQIPYGALLPRGLDNLLMTWCISATHVGWGTIRLEPTMMPVGEAAGWAAVLSDRQRVPPAELPTHDLLCTLVEHHMMVSFFSDIDVASEEKWVPAVQYLGTQGFFASYDARPNDALDPTTARLWALGCARILDRSADPPALAQRIAAVSSYDGTATAAGLIDALRIELERCGLATDLLAHLPPAGEVPLTRADAARMIYQIIAPA